MLINPNNKGQGKVMALWKTHAYKNQNSRIQLPTCKWKLIKGKKKNFFVIKNFGAAKSKKNWKITQMAHPLMD